MKAFPRLSRWLGRSIGHRFTLASVTTAVILILFLGAAAFPLLFYQAWRNFQGQSENEVQRLADQIEIRLNVVEQDLQHFAENSFVVNALVDSTGREIYLLPILRDFQLPFNISSSLIIFDASLEAIAGNQPDYGSLIADIRPLAERVFKEEAARIAIQPVRGQQKFIFAIPIFYPPASAFEGVLIGLLAPADILRMINLTAGTRCAVVVAGDIELLNTGCRPQPGQGMVRSELLKDSTAKRDTTLYVNFSRDMSSLYSLLAIILAAYVAIGIIAILGAYFLSRRAGRQFTRQLGLLSQASRDLADNPAAPTRVEWDRPDEIGRFAEAFNHMVTSLQELQASLEQRVVERTAELSAANRELEGFTFATSHDLKGPLGRINSFSTLLERNYRDRLEGDGLLFLNIIRQNATRLSQLVDDLMRHARIAQQDLELQEIDLPAALEAVVKEKSAEIQENRADFRVDLPAVHVLADSHALGQVLGNLVENALKYSSQVAYPRIEIGGEPVEERFRLWVRDNGVGFKMEYHDKIFEIFKRLHTYTEYTGSGVGLALVKRAMERMGGKVWAESAPGQGATFFLEFQMATQEAPGQRSGLAGVAGSGYTNSRI